MITNIAFLTVLLSSLVPIVLIKAPKLAKIFSFLFLSVSGASAIAAGLLTLITKNIFKLTINTNLPITMQLQLDPLSGFFLSIVGLIVIGAAFFGSNYLRSHKAGNNSYRPLQDGEQHKQLHITSKSERYIMFFTGLFVLGMYLVLFAHDVFSFMLSWELMSVSSYFLVNYKHENPANRRAAFIYLLMAHASGLLILSGFGVLAKFSNSLSFNDLLNAHLSITWATTAFIFALLGFGMKAGLVPLHVWLPQAHPVAPSHISALMSGVMLKVAVYGFIRFCFYLLGNSFWQWGVITLAIGTISAVLGVLYALMQHDLKKLLAYHSVENIGIIFIGLGLAMIFLATNNKILGALALIAALYHCLNHAIFKSLLFLGAGTIVQHAHEHDLEKMGGLIRKMPYTGLFFLIGCISISGLPPFNGFVSEWLTLQSAIQATVLQSGILRTLIPIAAALLALTSALAAACFVKVFGISFLGQPRTKHVHHAHDPKAMMLISMGFLAALCLLFGIMPSITVNLLNNIPIFLFNKGLTNTHDWLWLIPLKPNVSSYNALIIFSGIIIILFTIYFLLRLFCKAKIIKIAKPWECGFGGLSARMQYSATAFAMPIRRVFRGVWQVQEKVEITDVITYKLNIFDWVWKYGYKPLEKILLIINKNTSRIQGGNIRVYLSYIFFTLIILLLVVS